MKYIFFIVLLITISSCTKIDEEYINTDSTPYAFKDFNLYTSEIKNTIQTYYTFPHRRLKIDYIYRNTLYTNDSNNLFKFVSGFVLGYPHFYSDQSNFMLNKYRNAESIFQLDVFEDFNSNGFMDEVFQIEYEDSTVLQIRDHFILLNPKSKYDKTTDILTQTTILKEKRVNLHKEDGHNIRFVFLWKPVNEKNYLVFSKNNRLVYKKYKDLDSLIFWDINANKVFSICSEVPPGKLSNNDSNIVTGLNVFFFVSSPMNGHNWGKLKDYNNYLLKLSYCGGDSISLKVIKKLKDITQYEGIYNYFEDANYVYIVRNVINIDSKHSYFIEKYSKQTGELINKNEIEWKEGAYLKYHKIGSTFKFYFYDQILYYDSQTNSIKLKDIGLSLKLIGELVGLNPKNTYNPTDLRIRADVNGNGYNDFFISTSKNQLICIDGYTDKIIAASPKFPHPIYWCIGRIQNDKVIAIVYYKDKTYSFILTKNSLLTRLNAYAPTIVYAGGIIVIPFFLYILYRLYLATMFLLIFTQKTNYHGFAIIRKEFFSKKLKIVNYNSKFIEILGLQKSDNHFDNLPADMKRIIQNDIINKKGGIYEITINREELMFITFTTFIIKPILSKTYCILSVQDDTPVIKSQMIELYKSFVHKSSNELGMIYNRFSDLLYNLKKNYELDQSVTLQKEIIQEGIISLANSMRSLLRITKIEVYRENKNFTKVVYDWYTKNRAKFDGDGVNINLKLVDVGEYSLNVDAINNILDCAITNSVQAKVENRPMNIVLSLGSDQNYIYLEIIDNGIGMTPEYLEKITNWNDVMKTKGTGLGLRLIKKACDLHNADLIIESEYNVGTILKIRFKK